MKEKLLLIVLMISLLCILRAGAQESTSNGIKFERTLSFEEAKEKASKENKRYFLMPIPPGANHVGLWAI